MLYADYMYSDVSNNAIQDTSTNDSLADWFRCGINVDILLLLLNIVDDPISLLVSSLEDKSGFWTEDYET